MELNATYLCVRIRSLTLAPDFGSSADEEEFSQESSLECASALLLADRGFDLRAT
jgi:hypothetical protein